MPRVAPNTAPTIPLRHPFFRLYNAPVMRPASKNSITPDCPRKTDIKVDVNLKK